VLRRVRGVHPAIAGASMPPRSRRRSAGRRSADGRTKPRPHE